MHFIKFLHTGVIATVFSSACRIEVPNFSLYKPESLWHSVISELSEQQVVVLCDFAIFTKLSGHFLIPLVRMRKGKFAACHVHSVWLRSAGDIFTPPPHWLTRSTAVGHIHSALSHVVHRTWWQRTLYSIVSWGWWRHFDCHVAP